MQGAVENFIEGILADCGGACACATCHVYVDEAWVEKAGAPAPDEAAMLDMALDPAPNSRLGCQLTVTEELDGMVVRLPESQA